jgi:hypothetical protein
VVAPLAEGIGGVVVALVWYLRVADGFVPTCWSASARRDHGHGGKDLGPYGTHGGPAHT